MAEQQRLIQKLPAKYPIAFREGAYDKERFYEMARGMEEEKEGGERCFRCYELRLREAAETAKEAFTWIILRRHYLSARSKMRKN